MNEQPLTEDELIQKVREQILSELRNEDTRKKAEQEQLKEKARLTRAQYIDLMKQSSEPWVEVVSWGDTETGAQIELEWNDAFITYLKQNNITGISEEQIVQKWITFLLQEMTEQIEPQKTEFE